MPERQDDSNAVTGHVTRAAAGRFSRRRILQLSGTAIAGGAAATGSTTASSQQSVSNSVAATSSRSDDTYAIRLPLGGGEGYEHVVHPDEADVVVETFAELGRALSSATGGDVVYVDGDAGIHLGETTFTVPSGVTLASDRGIDDAPGGLLYTDAETDLLDVHADARVTGLRLQGPYYDYFDPSWYAVGSGIRTVDDGVEVDNCEVWGFAHAGIYAAGDADVHHNHVHHNARDGLGYGVLAAGGRPVVEWNYFDYNRHSVASTGDHHGYTVRFNHFAADAAGGVVDVQSPGGVSSEVHNNIVEAVDDVRGRKDALQAVQVRGVPDETFDVYANWFFNPGPPRDSPASAWTNEAIIQPTETAWRNVEFWDNYYGADADVSSSDIIPGYEY